MKIALLTDGISPYVTGGMQRHSYYLAKYFAKRKVNVYLFQPKLEVSEATQLDVFDEEERGYIHSFLIDVPKKMRIPGHYISESKMFSDHIFEVLSSFINEIDYVYAKGFTAYRLLNEKELGLKCPPIGINFHGYEMFQPPNNIITFWNCFLMKKAVQPMLDKADFVHSYGGNISELLINKANVSPKKLIELPGGIEGNWLYESNKTPRSSGMTHFLFVGRFDQRKGIKEINEVLNQHLNSILYEFSFIGPIPDSSKIRNPNVHYYGEIKVAEDIKLIMQKSDVLVCPSYSEGMPNVILEAMASKMAIITTDVGAINTLVDLSCALLIETQNSKALWEAMKTYQKMNDQLLGKQQYAAFEIIKNNFIWDQLIVSTLQKIENCIK
jgi:glycosyltransferase involved in cell wall biosynthesis